MSNNKKSKINKIEKLRQILDNPYDSRIKKSILKDNKSLESIRRKLSDEKSDTLEPSFVVHKEEATKEIESKKNTGEEPATTFREDKTKVFQEIKEDEMTAFEEIDITNEIQMYQRITIFEMWSFTLVLGVVAVSGLFLLRDWLFLNFGVYGDKLIPTPNGIQNIHIWFGFALAFLGIFHIAVHVFSNKKDILPKQTFQDFKAFLHSGMYLIGLAREEDYNSGRFYGRQRIVYLALVYILGLTIITGLLYYMNLLSNDLTMVHVVPAGLSIMVLLFHVLITIRKHDTAALNCAFITGKLPIGYIRKNHPVWYEQIMAEKESTLKRKPHPITALKNKTLVERGKNLTNAVSNFALLTNNSPDVDDIKSLTRELRANLHPDKLKRIIELSEELKDETEEENKQDAK